MKHRSFPRTRNDWIRMHPFVKNIAINQPSFHEDEVLFKVTRILPHTLHILCYSPTRGLGTDHAEYTIWVDPSDAFAQKLGLSGSFVNINKSPLKLTARFALNREARRREFLVEFKEVLLHIPGTKNTPAWSEAVLCFEVTPRISAGRTLRLVKN